MKKSITIELDKFVAQHLDDMAALLGTTRDQIVTSAIEDQWRQRHHLLGAECPWEITLRAKQEYLSIVGKPATPETLDEATDVLEAAAVDAVKAEREGQRKPTPQDSGALRYRGPKPRRLMLHVVPEMVHADGRPQLVHVRVSGPRGSR